MKAKRQIEALRNIDTKPCRGYLTNHNPIERIVAGLDKTQILIYSSQLEMICFEAGINKYQASASQKAEAVLRCLGLWEDGE